MEVAASSGCSSVKNGNGEKRQEKKEAVEMTDKPFADDDQEDEEEDHHEVIADFVPAPPVPLKEKLDKDKGTHQEQANLKYGQHEGDDESLRRWKEKLLGFLESNLNGQMDPEVTFHSIGILSDYFGEINTALPVAEVQKGHPLFTIREGSEYRLKLKFSVLHNIGSGLTYTNSVWKGSRSKQRNVGYFCSTARTIRTYVR